MGLVIGLTGTKASGKTEIARFLQSLGFEYISLSDMVRGEAKARGHENAPINILVNIGNDLREKYGNGVLAERAVELIKDKEKIVVDGIRNLGEIEAFRKNLLSFFLAGIDSDTNVRFERLKKRGRESDPKTMEDIKAMDARDRGAEEKDSGQQVDKCLQSVDYIQITSGTIDEENNKFKSQFLNLIIGEKPRRPSFEELFMMQAHTSSKRSTCLSRKVGAVLVLNNHIVGTGYNGSPPGMKHCDELGGCLRKKLNVKSGERHEICRAIHAEMNALLHTKSTDASGSTVYITTSPCSMCARLLIGAGVIRIVYDGDYPDEFAMNLMKESNIKMERFNGIRPVAYHKLFK